MTLRVQGGHHWCHMNVCVLSGALCEQPALLFSRLGKTPSAALGKTLQALDYGATTLLVDVRDTKKVWKRMQLDSFEGTSQGPMFEKLEK